MRQQELLEKLKLGYSELTGRVYLFLPAKDGSARTKVDVTDQFFAIMKKFDNFKQMIKGYDV